MIVEVPQIQHGEKIVERKALQIECAEKIVEVLQVQLVEKIVEKELPQVEYHEKITTVYRTTCRI